ncbi:MAG: sarcosine oxidase subunit alpha family protein [Gammaproteobacteria bacterium]|nr:sarcosine oxidase subunit alpha family protein [Gammaproteobacteria bacterium]
MTGQPRRLPGGGRVDRTSPISFTFDGRTYQGLRGDTLASALLANGVDVVARSFKFGRPRGVVGSGAEEPNAIVQVGTGTHALPNQRATQVELYDGLVGASSAAHGLRGLIDAVRRVLPAGFYYKMLMAPPILWRFWEQVLRRGAGLGTVPQGADPDRYDKLNRHSDVMVVGAGPAGLAAALVAARSGARVVIADEQDAFGGSLLSSAMHIDNRPAAEWVVDAVRELRTFEDVVMLPRSTVVGLYDHSFLTVLERCADHRPSTTGSRVRQRLHRVRAREVVLAAGAIERPLVFANNDLPGVMLASAVSCYVNRFGVAPGERLLLATNNDGGYQTALDWQRAGREVVAVADTRVDPSGELPRAVREAGIPVLAGHGVIEAVGHARVRAARVAPLDPAGVAVTGVARRIDCDLIACAGGWNPAVHLSSQLGTRPVWSDEAVGFVAGQRRGLHCAGAVTGAATVEACLAQGATAAASAAEAAGFATDEYEWPRTDEATQDAQQALFVIPHLRRTSRAPPQFVDLQLDVTAADIELAAREGYESVEHAKRYTALGFGTDQGKLGNVNGIAILARTLGREIGEVGTTMFRPAYTPATFGAIAGRDVGGLFDPERHTPMHAWHEARGAVWEDVGRWKRPRYYPQPGEDMDAAVVRECIAARTSVAMMDASTLGKIDVQGRDAARFLDRIYAGGFLRLGVGRCRYGVMLKDDGMIFDDGVTVRLDDERYLMHTTTGNAEAVLAWLELWRQTEWPDLDVHLTSVTDHWATAAVVGPKAREVLGRVCSDIDLGPVAFPFMAYREGHVAGVRARVLRISFSGELSFEVNVAAGQAVAVWEALMAAGSADGITPYGTETMHVLRAEKGFIIVGQDTDGSMTPHDMGLDWAVRHGKRHGFVGERSLALADYQRADRLQLVGLRTVEPATVIPEGAQIVADVDRMRSGRVPMRGFVTSSYFSATLKRSIALAMLKGGRGRLGETVHCPLDNGAVLAAEVVDPVFYDPDGERQNA